MTTSAVKAWWLLFVGSLLAFGLNACSPDPSAFAHAAEQRLAQRFFATIDAARAGDGSAKLILPEGTSMKEGGFQHLASIVPAAQPRGTAWR